MRRPLLEESSTSSCYSADVPSTSSSTVALSTVTQMTRLSLQDDPNTSHTGPRSCSFSVPSTRRQPRSVSMSIRPKWRSSTESSLASSSGNSWGSNLTNCHSSPFDQPSMSTDFFVAPNANADGMQSLASWSQAAAGSPGKTGFLDKIKTVFRPRIGSKSSVHSVKSNAEDLGEQWISVYYYEYAERVGDVYSSSGSEISITGHRERHTSFDMNLGSLMKGNRNSTVRSVRGAVGSGVKFYNRGGDIFIDCLSESPVFVQAPLHAHSQGDHMATVYRLPPGQAMLVFPANVFDTLICEAQRRGSEAISALAQICNIRVSFGRGWGSEYRVQKVLGLPCWVDITLTGAIAELDELDTVHRRRFLQNQEESGFSENELLEETEEE